MAAQPKPVVVDLPQIHLAVVRAASDTPDAIKAAWARLEAPLASLRGHRFYGVCYGSGPQEGYYAGLELQNDAEAASLGFELLPIEAGRFVRLNVKHWRTRITEIPELVQALERDFATDHDRPTIEFYRSQTELHLLVPLRDS